MSDTSTTAFPTRPGGPDPLAAPEPASGRHPVNVAHLVIGIAFLGLSLVWALVQYDAVADHDIRWLLPVPWVLAGVAGVAATATAGARRHQGRTTSQPDLPDQPDRPHQEQS